MNPVNWLDHATRSIHSRHPQAAGCSDYIAQRLSNLLLERLPVDIAERLVGLLPDTTRDLFDVLNASALERPETSIGYQHFVDRTAFALGCSGCVSAPTDSDAFEPELKALAKQVTDTFLWACAKDLPHDLKTGIARALPGELRARMDLFEQTEAA